MKLKFLDTTCIQLSNLGILASNKTSGDDYVKESLLNY